MFLLPEYSLAKSGFFNKVKPLEQTLGGSVSARDRRVPGNLLTGLSE
jgi:hypothetical protein